MWSRLLRRHVSLMYWLILLILLFRLGLSYLQGSSHNMISLCGFLFVVVSTNDRTAFTHSASVWLGVLLVPAANTIMSLVLSRTMLVIRASICCAVWPGLVNPVASSSGPCTSGARPRTSELPIIVICRGILSYAPDFKHIWCIYFINPLTLDTFWIERDKYMNLFCYSLFIILLWINYNIALSHVFSL